jgi:hypothetical protein
MLNAEKKIRKEKNGRTILCGAKKGFLERGQERRMTLSRKQKKITLSKIMVKTTNGGSFP